MLILSRTKGQRIIIGPGVIPEGGLVIQFLEMRGRSARLGITAPPEIAVDREEVVAQRDAGRRREGGDR